MMKTPTLNSSRPSHSRPAADIPKKQHSMKNCFVCFFWSSLPLCRQSAETEVKFKRIIFSTGKTINPKDESLTLLF